MGFASIRTLPVAMHGERYWYVSKGPAVLALYIDFHGKWVFYATMNVDDESIGSMRLFFNSLI